MTDTQLYLAVGVPTIALVLGMIGNGSVSYTHLDVYKRQARQCQGKQTG